LLHDRARLLRILENSERPVQLIIAGKAHPEDKPGQAMIQEWVNFIRQPEIRPHVIFLSDYDMLLTEQLVQGVDVWLNTPRRPWEACGTSGMKVLVNGGINLSERDGWWAEAYAPETGWALGDGREHGEDPAWDAIEAQALYDIIEHEVIPQFYTRDAAGIPAAWVAKIRESMAVLTPQFSTNRSERQYTEQYYLPAAAAYRLRAANNGAVGTRIVEWRHRLEESWESMNFGAVNCKSIDGQNLFEIIVYLGALDPQEIRVELYADGGDGSVPSRVEMALSRQAEGMSGSYTYSASGSGSRAAADYTARLMPRGEDVILPLEGVKILWQR